MQSQPDFCRDVHRLQTTDDAPAGTLQNLMALIASATFASSLVLIGYVIAGLSS